MLVIAARGKFQHTMLSFWSEPTNCCVLSRASAQVEEEVQLPEDGPVLPLRRHSGRMPHVHHVCVCVLACLAWRIKRSGSLLHPRARARPRARGGERPAWRDVPW